jgi:protein-tyrosine-phosphatase
MTVALSACRHNAGRSQVHHQVVEAMRVLGVDLAGRRPRRLDGDVAGQADVPVVP